MRGPFLFPSHRRQQQGEDDGQHQQSAPDSHRALGGGRIRKIVAADRAAVVVGLHLTGAGWALAFSERLGFVNFHGPRLFKNAAPVKGCGFDVGHDERERAAPAEGVQTAAQPAAGLKVGPAENVVTPRRR